MTRAYLLVEVDSSSSRVLERLRSHSLGSCKQLVEALFSGEIVCHLHCDGGGFLNAAVVELASVEGDKKLTVLAVFNE